jgi:hypothetical protein
MFITYFHIKFHLSTANDLLDIITKTTGKGNICIVVAFNKIQLWILLIKHIYVFCIILPINIAYFPKIINWIPFVMEMWCYLWAR